MVVVGGPATYPFREVFSDHLQKVVCIRPRYSPLLVFLSMAAPGCERSSDAFEGGLGVAEYRVLAEIPGAREQRLPVLVVPDSVEAGLPFRVELTTVVGGCERAGEVQIRRTDQQITFIPYTYERRDSGLICPPILGLPRRTLTLQLDQPGEVLLRVRGQVRDADGKVRTRTLERRIVVREPEGYRCDPPHFTARCR